MPAKKKRDWFDYAGPIITSVVGAFIVISVSKGCATSSDTHAAVTNLTSATIPLLSKDVETTKTNVTSLQSDVSKLRGDVSDVKGQAVTKSELDTKNQGLQNQFQRVYDSQAKLNDKLGEIQVEALKKK